MSSRVNELQTALTEVSDDNHMLRLKVHSLQREREEMLATKTLQQEAMETTNSDFRQQLNAQHEELMRLQNDYATLAAHKDTIERVRTCCYYSPIVSNVVGKCLFEKPHSHG